MTAGPLTPRQRLDRMYEEAFSRLPSETEAADALAFVHGQSDEARAWSDLAHVLYSTKEFIFVN